MTVLWWVHVSYRYVHLDILQYRRVFTNPISSALHVPVTYIQRPCLLLLYVVKVRRSARTLKNAARDLLFFFFSACCTSLSPAALVMAVKVLFREEHVSNSRQLRCFGASGPPTSNV